MKVVCQPLAVFRRRVCRITLLSAVRIMARAPAFAGKPNLVRAGCQRSHAAHWLIQTP
jgi:hypothetical protein